MGGTDLSVLPQRQVVFPETVFRSDSPGSIPLRVEAISGQTAYLTEWKNGSGSVVAHVDANGKFTTPALKVFGTNDNSLFIAHGRTDAVGIILRGAPGQSVSLQEWQNSAGTLMSRFDQNASLFLAGPGEAVLHVGTTNFVDGLIYAQAYAPTRKVIIARGAASQTANLQEWQRSDGALLARVNSGGTISASGSIVAGGEGAMANTYINSYIGFASGIGLAVRGFAGQTGDLAQFKNSTDGIIASISGNGTFFAQGLNVLGNGSSPAPNANMTISAHATTNIPIVARAFTGGGQTSSLQEWQNNGGGALAWVNASGHGYFARTFDGNQRVSIRGNRADTNIVDPNVYYQDGGSLNAYWGTGVYNIVNFSNGPWAAGVDGRWIWMEVFTHISGAHWQKQIVHDMTGGNAVYWRVCDGGDPTVAASWTAWAYRYG